MGKAWNYVVEFNFHFIPLCFLLLPLIGWIRAGRGKPAVGLDGMERWEQFLLLLLPSYFAIILVAPGFYLRYLLPLLPIMCLLAAAWTFRYVKWRALAVAVIAIQDLSNAFALVTAYPVRGAHTFRVPLWNYLHGIATPYPERLADVVDFFKREAHPKDMIMSFDPEMPLRFYTRFAVIDGVLVAPGRLPEWILPNSASGIYVQEPVALPDFLKPYYETITIQVHDSVRWGSIPEPDIYQYQGVQTRVPFVIYHLKAGTNDHRPP